MTQTSNLVTIEDAVQFDGKDPGPVLAVAAGLGRTEGGTLWVVAANERLLLVGRGDYVVRFGPGDLGVMSAREYERFFGGTL